MAQQIECIEMLARDRKVLCPGEQVRRQDVLGVLDQFILREAIDEIGDFAGTDECEDKAAGALDNGVRAFQQDSQQKDLTYATFVHGARSFPSALVASSSTRSRSPHRAQHSTA